MYGSSLRGYAGWRHGPPPDTGHAEPSVVVWLSAACPWRCDIPTNRPSLLLCLKSPTRRLAWLYWGCSRTGGRYIRCGRPGVLRFGPSRPSPFHHDCHRRPLPVERSARRGTNAGSEPAEISQESHRISAIHASRTRLPRGKHRRVHRHRRSRASNAGNSGQRR
jgi:hypothetical protein